MRIRVVGALVVGALVLGGCGNNTDGETTSAAGGGGSNGTGGTSTVAPSTGGSGGIATATGGAGGTGGNATTSTTSSTTSTSTGTGGSGGSGGSGGASTTASSTHASSVSSTASSSSTTVSSTGTGQNCTPPISGGACDTFPQCGCSGTQNCDVTTVTGITTCEPSGSVPAYGNCTDVGQCAKGYQCVGDVCQPFCGNDVDCVGPGRECIQVTGGGDPPAPIPADFVCTAGCDPRNTAATCGPGTTCLFYDGLSTQCFRSTGSSTTTCNSSTDPFSCAKGYACATDDVCRKWCRISIPSDCPSGQTCVDTADSLNGVAYGICE